MEQTLLPPELRERLRGEDWTVTGGDARLGARDVFMGDKLTCPACAAGHAAIQ
ncbi:hypothetical protein ACIBF1_30170 [Spirillospora sp. NPDC050679]